MTCPRGGKRGAPDVPRQLGHLDLGLELLLERRVQHSALGRLKPVKEVRDRPDIVVLEEEYKLTVNEVVIVDATSCTRQ